ncbi:MAG: photoactive yellow protein [Leptospiraceae bacterium]|nr:photoactive yellow protein [Leptospiraceae bacterium]MCP5495214.1 photoactive yellow protein [Leptospiraceae bacterium]
MYELPNAELNSQDFGIIKLEDSGKILFYNTYESELANISPKTAEGKNFFFEIAPCTNNRLFLGSFQKGIEIGENKMLFFYTFTYRMKPTNVKVMIFRKSGAKENWVFIKKNFT